LRRKIREIARTLKPPRCPRCGSIIESFSYIAKEIVRATYLGNGNYCCWDTLEVLNSEFRCPECEEILCHHEDEAEKFLRGEN